MTHDQERTLARLRIEQIRAEIRAETLARLRAKRASRDDRSGKAHNPPGGVSESLRDEVARSS